MAIHHQPVMLCLTCYVQEYIEQKYHAIKDSHQGVCVCVCVCVWGGFYCTTEAASLIKKVIFCWDIRGNYATKSTVTECVKRLCLGCVDELLEPSWSFRRLTGRRDSEVRSTVPVEDILHMNG